MFKLVKIFKQAFNKRFKYRAITDNKILIHFWSKLSFKDIFFYFCMLLFKMME